MGRKAFSAQGAAAIGPYSHAVEANGLLLLSGQTPIDPATGSLKVGSVAQQTDQCFENLRAVLDSAGLTFDDVVSVQVFLTDMANFQQMNAAYERHFTPPYPARTTIGCASLPLNAAVEVACIAELRSTTK
jgi:2-iminobutanoate/2-iminopropanoate deaminase